MHGYVVEYQPGAWLTKRGATERIDLAFVYGTEAGARRALSSFALRMFHRGSRDGFPEAQVYPVRVRVERVAP